MPTGLGMFGPGCCCREPGLPCAGCPEGEVPTNATASVTFSGFTDGFCVCSALNGSWIPNRVTCSSGPPGLIAFNVGAVTTANCTEGGVTTSRNVGVGAQVWNLASATISGSANASISPYTAFSQSGTGAGPRNCYGVITVSGISQTMTAGMCGGGTVTADVTFSGG